MAKGNRKRNRNRPSNTPAAPIETGPQRARRLLDVLPPADFTFIPNVRLGTGANAATPPPAEDGEDGQPEPRRESRANSVKRGLRSKLLFPLELKEAIDELAIAYSQQLLPLTALERWLVFELARSSVQSDEINDQLLINKVRIIERVGTCWDDDCAERIEKQASKLQASPYTVQRALARTKHGTLYLINKLELLGEAVESNGGLDDSQIQMCYDLIGIEHVYRNGCRRVPPGTDAGALRSLITGEIARHRLNLERALNARSDSEKDMAQLGIARYPDSQTRAIRADLNRARKRFSWALETLRQLQQGADPKTILDPDTGKPIAAGPPPMAVPDPKRPAASPPPAPAPQPAPAPAPAPESPASPAIPPLPAGCSEESKEMWWVAAGAILSPSATLPGDEPGSPPIA